MKMPRCIKCDKKPSNPRYGKQFCSMRCAAGYGMMSASSFIWCGKHSLWFNSEECNECWDERRVGSAGAKL